MMDYLKLALSVAAWLIAGLLKKYCSSRFKDKEITPYVYNLVTSLVCVITLMAVSDEIHISGFTFFLGIAFGIVTATGCVFNLKAIEIGPLAYTSVIGTLSMIIPAASGYLFWGETITPVQFAGIAFMLVSLGLSVDFSDGRKDASLKWFMFSMIAFLCTGLIGVMQKWHQNTVFRSELDGFLVVAFAFSIVFSAVMVAVKNRRSRSYLRREMSPLLIFMMMISGVCIAANNKINLYLSGVLDSAVFFPTVNGGCLILITVASVLIFREKLSKKQWLGIGAGIVAVLLLCGVL